MADDQFANPVSALAWWGLPTVLGIAASLLGLPLGLIAFVWMTLFVWMGTGCIRNAVNCHRLHCYLSAPVFLLGAAVCGLIATGLLVLWPHALNNTVSITFVLALLSFVPEVIWGKYTN
jgi:hypothetical protein